MVLLLLLILSGCSYVKRYPGVSIKENDLKQLQVNQSSVGDIFKVLGAPTFMSVHDPVHRLYYASMELRVAPDRSAKVLHSTIYLLTVTDKGILSKIDTFSGNREISRCSQKTEPVYKKARFIEEILASSAARFK